MTSRLLGFRICRSVILFARGYSGCSHRGFDSFEPCALLLLAEGGFARRLPAIGRIIHHVSCPERGSVTSTGGASLLIIEIDLTCYFDIINARNPWHCRRLQQPLLILRGCGGAARPCDIRAREKP
jgi:hypothetical protein